MRKLKFRETKDPYKIWVSEIMLQQTRVNAMLDSFERFILEFPNIQSLANSKEGDVLRLWRGLGYYSRALNLRKGAIFIQEHYDGKFPRSLKEALEIPGIGPYTARAILSIAFDIPEAVLDGNVKRVLSRYSLYDKNINTSTSHKELQSIADTFLNHKFPGDHNQALMELGATLCNTIAQCNQCPLQKSCKAFKQGRQKEIPIISKESKKISIELLFFIIQKDGLILLEKNKNRRFLKTIYTPPFLVNGNDLPENYNNYDEFINILTSENYKIIDTAKKHSITNHDILLKLTKLKFKANWNKILENKDICWIKEDDWEKIFASSIAGKIKTFIR
jgi:A/G-specific adenine glycosylase